MAFERLAVTAILRSAKNGDTDGLPGKRLAQTAIDRGVPLTSDNYLSAPTINAPSGVYATLARHAELIEKREFVPCRDGEVLIESWAEDAGLFGILSSTGSETGRNWIRKIVDCTSRVASSKHWPARGDKLWGEIGSRLLLGQIGTRERKNLRKVLRSDPTRCRMMALLQGTCMTTPPTDLAGTQRQYLWKCIRPGLSATDAEDVSIWRAIVLAEGVELPAAVLEAMFYEILETLRETGVDSTDALCSISGFAERWQVLQKQLRSTVKSLERALSACFQPALGKELRELRDDVTAALEQKGEGVTALLTRHERTQAAKKKGPWIMRSDGRLLVVGINRGSEGRTEVVNGYTHPLRVAAMTTLMRDVGLWKQMPPEEPQ